MKLTTLATIVLCLCAFTSFAQSSYSIRGFTVDTVAKAKLTATVTLLDAKDSILVKFTHAADDGSFDMNGLPAGNYLLLITYPDYADYVEGFNITPANKTHDFGNISMGLKSRILQEVIIKGTVSAIKIKGDTTEFNAKAYVIQPNSKVEDLLKQLPGMEVDKDGKITFQGEKINKVLVDGEEFFGDDPKLVTQNLRGDMVDKIQVYDKKSDQAAFTGIDDGVKNKVLNVKLKEDKKNGTFGKINAGLGTDEYNEVQALYNRFKNKEKFSAYATAANDGKQGLGFQDNAKLGTSGSNVQISDDGGSISVFGGQDDVESGFGTYNGAGLPLSRAGGVHYDNKWNNDKESINTNYKIGSLAVNTDQTTLTQRTLGTAISNTDNVSNSHNYTFRQKLDAVYQKAFSPTANLKIDVNGTDKNTDSRSNGVNTTEDGNNLLVNKTTSNNSSNGQQKLFNASAFYTKKFKTVGRTFSWDVNETYTKSTYAGYIYNDVYTAIDGKDSITNQYKPTTLISSVLNSNMTYTEPITKKLALTFNYGLGLNNSTADRESYNKSASGNYDSFDVIHSSDYKFNQLTTQLGAAFNYRFGGSILTFGAKASAVNFKQIDSFTGDVYKRDFINWLPRITYQYKASQTKSFNFNYNGSTSQPQISQIQPLRSNYDPINIYVGNPNLKPSFNNRVNARYSASLPLTNQYFAISGDFGTTTNQIINNSTYDITTGKQVTQAINLTDKTPYNYNFSLNGSKKIPALDMGINASIYINGGLSYFYTNGVLNTNHNASYNMSIGLNKYKANKYSFYFNGGPNYTLQDILPNNSNNNNAFGYNLYGGATIYLPAHYMLASDINNNYSAATKNLPATNKAMWNASFSKMFLKEKNLKLSISANNLLDQDQNRRFSYNGITQQTLSNSIRRYFMFTVTWDFTKFGTSDTAKK
ncbi:outer membrane beta-barrel protein [Mucilaginibacter sp.]|uniref:outer membrane beta-barrel protein n=1 Tax=Mucilaginibacter sp. TaxID=1882438 RepID=UPI0026155CB7|nr:outer membrane beta-barrel protein [Mucilaginibacter sp.]MDB5032011.1 outer rane beta-barrel protein [Mucilaginibacter sp.]